MLFDQITIVGVGLIGGSIGLATKAHNVAGRVVGVGRDARSLARAAELGAIDSWSLDLADGVQGSGLVVVCTPVDQIADVILTAAESLSPGTLFTDAGSVKGSIIASVKGKLPGGIEFVPAHPLAGSEKSGIEHAQADLFLNRTAVLTPTPENNPGAISQVERFWRALGSRVVQMSASEHDQILALTSHLPHVIAAAVAGTTSPEFLGLTAGGFRDVTRIASGDPGLWSAIFLANRESVLAAVGAFTDRLSEFRIMLEAGDGAGLVRWLTEAKQVRDALGR